MNEMLTVGGLEVEMSAAESWVARYVRTNSGLWSYPAYDSYPGSGTPQLAEQDLLAVALLNAHQKPITSYYTLVGLLPELNTRLTALGTAHSLVDADTDQLKNIAKPFGVLDDRKTPEVGLTKLSKVLHRKRPHLLPLYDRNIKHLDFQVGPTPRLSFVKGRSWEGYGKVWIEAVQQDLQSQRAKWRHLASLATDPAISPLRALDIVAWGLGETRNPPKELIGARPMQRPHMTTNSLGWPA
ncbi:hypothetical protein QFZ23_003640 [Arthrobacter globiformis]|uniref:DUF6308 family protein n=1 Tax=Arthrobacter globiformis TaxID=1665 RepID=UPI0027879B0C|nr:DUF6308 family protein [Arthrobacter globiformis]MDQ1059739.1 hypothetical protein [Arthrobacter globiformis]